LLSPMTSDAVVHRHIVTAGVPTWLENPRFLLEKVFRFLFF